MVEVLVGRIQRVVDFESAATLGQNPGDIHFPHEVSSKRAAECKDAGAVGAGGGYRDAAYACREHADFTDTVSNNPGVASAQ